MRFSPSLEQGRLLRRYKRFLADIELASGEQMTIHCPNTGSMLNCMREGGQVWFSRSNDPKRKLPGTWEISETPGAVGLREYRAGQCIGRRGPARRHYH